MKIMISKGVVSEILEEVDGLQKVKIVYKDGVESKAIAYLDFVNPLSRGDEVLSNRLANSLSLGTGGYDFIISNFSAPELNRINGHGHIIKMPYTPFQSAVLSAEEKDSQYHDVLKDGKSIAQMPVIVCSLHSHLLPAVATLKFHKPGLKIACIMTDSAALPVQFSDTLRLLKEKFNINTITCGNAFGGDIEAVSIYTALVAARYVAESDVSIVSMGPGIKGTATTYGYSGIEQGWIIDAINTLEGMPIFSPRISFADKRQRHKGFSHHSMTTLAKVAKTACRVAIPKIENSDNLELIKKQLEESCLNEQHIVTFEAAGNLGDILESFGLQVSSMGRGLKDDPYFFETASAAALAALGCLEKNAG